MATTRPANSLSQQPGSDHRASHSRRQPNDPTDELSQMARPQHPSTRDRHGDRGDEQSCCRQTHPPPLDVAFPHPDIETALSRALRTGAALGFINSHGLPLANTLPSCCSGTWRGLGPSGDRCTRCPVPARTAVLGRSIPSMSPRRRAGMPVLQRCCRYTRAQFGPAQFRAGPR